VKKKTLPYKKRWGSFSNSDLLETSYQKYGIKNMGSKTWDQKHGIKNIGSKLSKSEFPGVPCNNFDTRLFKIIQIKISRRGLLSWWITQGHWSGPHSWSLRPDPWWKGPDPGWKGMTLWLSTVGPPTGPHPGLFIMIMMLFVGEKMGKFSKFGIIEKKMIWIAQNLNWTGRWIRNSAKSELKRWWSELNR
jgi:hypothetical protein